MKENMWGGYSSLGELLAASGISFNGVDNASPISVTEDDGVTTVVYANGMKVMYGFGDISVIRGGRVHNMHAQNISQNFGIRTEGGTTYIGGANGIRIGADGSVSLGGANGIFVGPDGTVRMGGMSFGGGGVTGCGNSNSTTTITVNGRTTVVRGGNNFGTSVLGIGLDPDTLARLFSLGVTVTGDPGTDAREGGAEAEFDGHAYFASRNIGLCKKLVGDVTLVNFMVDDTSATWSSAAERDKLKSDVRAACDRISSFARTFGVNLRLRPVFKRVKISCKAGRTNHDKFGRCFSEALGCRSVAEVHQNLVREYGGDEVAIIVLPHHDARSFAFTEEKGTAPHNFEYAMVYDVWNRAGVYIHELLHLFGAADFYYPADTVRAAKLYLPNSIMAGSLLECDIDDLTRYLIGWTDKLTANAKQFLRATRHYTLFDLHRARRSV